jgi:hypothetical protein
MNRRFLPLLSLILGLALLLLAGPAGLAVENAVVEARMLEDIKYLASDECEGRGVNTKGINLAADYIAAKFKEAGLKPANGGSYFQPFDLPSASKLVGGSEANRLLLKGPLGQTIELELGKHFNVLGFGHSGKVKAPIVFVGYGVTAPEHQYDDYSEMNVAGKVVVVVRNVPRQNSKEGAVFPANEGQINRHARLDAKASNAEVHKAAAVIFVNDNQTAAEASDALRAFSDPGDAVGIPLVHVRRPIVNAMIRSQTGEDLSVIEKGIDRDVRPDSFALDGWTAELETAIERTITPVKNVVAVAEGSGPLANETIVIGGHYDHLGRGERGSLARGSTDIHYGADDNASGTTTLIELARRFGEMKDRKGRRIVFIAFTGEEKGLLGSRHYTTKPLFPLDSTAAMINLDMVGRLREDKVQIYGTGTAKDFNELLDKLNGKHNFKMSKTAGTQMLGGSSDHESFNRKSIPTLFFFTGTHPQYHRPTDKWDLINVEGMRRIAEIVTEITVALSTVEKRPEYVKVSSPAGSGGVRFSGPTLGIMPSYSEDDKLEGLLLDGVSPGRPAEKAGLKAGDRIIDISGKPVKNLTNYMTVMNGFKKGDKLDVTIIRDGKPMKIVVPLE